MKPEIDLKSELAKAIWISMAKPKSEHVEKIFSSLKKEMNFCETTYTLKPTLKVLLEPRLKIQSKKMQNKRRCKIKCKNKKNILCLNIFL